MVFRLTPHEPPRPSIEDIPQFKYFAPEAITDEFVLSDKSCSVCGNGKGIMCDFRPYSEQYYSIQPFCPDCLINGAAAQNYDGTFNVGFVEYSENGETIISNPAAKEASLEVVDCIEHRTPPLPSDDPAWLFHCGDAARFLKSVDGPTFRELEVEMRPDWEEFGLCAWDELMQPHLLNEVSILIFECLHCGKKLFKAEMS